LATFSGLACQKPAGWKDATCRATGLCHDMSPAGVGYAGVGGFGVVVLEQWHGLAGLAEQRRE
jgi:hypothetical protein